MSKSDYVSVSFHASEDPVPTYEEVLASSNAPSFSNTSTIRQIRTRRIHNVVTESIIPCFAAHVSNLSNHVTIVLVPSETLPISNTGALSAQSIVSPSLQAHRTSGNVFTLMGEENRTPFWTQSTVVQELDHILRGQLSRPTLTKSSPVAKKSSFLDEKQTTQASLPPLQVQRGLGSQLPRRPSKQSWLKRTFSLPEESHDPTGETGKWNLGWRSPLELSESGVEYSWTAKPSTTRTEKLEPDEVAVQTQLMDVSFRTESEMGLLQTTTVKCIWIEIEVGV